MKLSAPENTWHYQDHNLFEKAVWECSQFILREALCRGLPVCTLSLSEGFLTSAATETNKF